MARFDLFQRRGWPGYLLDCQADIVTGLGVRLVVPLMAEKDAPKPVKRLNPVFGIDGERYVMVTQFAAAATIGELGKAVRSLRHEQDAIAAALDLLVTGF